MFRPFEEYLVVDWRAVVVVMPSCLSLRLIWGERRVKSTVESILPRGASITLDWSILFGSITDLTSERGAICCSYWRRDQCLLRGEGANISVETPNLGFLMGEFIPVVLHWERVVSGLIVPALPGPLGGGGRPLVENLKVWMLSLLKISATIFSCLSSFSVLV